MQPLYTQLPIASTDVNPVPSQKRKRCSDFFFLYPPWEAFLSLGNSVNYNLLKASKGHKTSKKCIPAPVFTKVQAEPSRDPGF